MVGDKKHIYEESLKDADFLIMINYKYSTSPY